VCTILLRLAPKGDEPVVLAANRDEYHDRPADDPHAIRPGVFAGRDRRAGGTWLAVGAGGLAALTNVASARREDAPSRGDLPLAALAGRLPADFSRYNPFNLLVIDRNGAWLLAHGPDGVTRGPFVLDPGDHVIVNEPFGADGGPRAHHAAELVAGAPPGFDVLASHGAHGDDGLCHHGDVYGTVSSTVVALDRSLRVVRYLHRPGLPCRTDSVDLTAAARAATGR
jgi:hypothetical protein